MYYQRKEFRSISAGLQMAAAGAMAIALATAPISRAQSCDPPPAGTMVAWYSFDQTGPVNTAGQFTSANLATQNSGAWTSPTLPTAVAGEVSGGLSFNGNSYIDTPDSIVTNFGPAGGAACGGDYSTCQGNFSMDAWVNLTTVPLSGVNVIFDKRPRSEIGYSFYLYGQPGEEGGYPWMGLQLGDRAHGYTNYGSPALGPGTGNPNTGLVGLTANTWHHLAVTVQRRGATGILWYLDGYPVPNTAPEIPTQTGTLVNNVPLRIGANGPANGGGSYFNGSLDELQIFNSILTPAQVLAIYNALSSGECKP